MSTISLFLPEKESFSPPFLTSRAFHFTDFIIFRKRHFMVPPAIILPGMWWECDPPTRRSQLALLGLRGSQGPRLQVVRHGHDASLDVTILTVFEVAHVKSVSQLIMWQSIPVTVFPCPAMPQLKYLMITVPLKLACEQEAFLSRQKKERGLIAAIDDAFHVHFFGRFFLCGSFRGGWTSRSEVFFFFLWWSQSVRPSVLLRLANCPFVLRGTTINGQ